MNKMEHNDNYNDVNGFPFYKVCSYFLSIIIVINMLKLSTLTVQINQFGGFCTLISNICILIMFLLSNYKNNKYNVLPFFNVGVIFFIVTFVFNSFNFGWLFMLSWGLTTIPLNRICKIFSKTMIFSTLTIIILSFFNITINIIQIRLGEIDGRTLGFINKNTFGVILIICYVCLCFLLKKNIFRFILLILFSTFTLLVPNSATSSIAIITIGLLYILIDIFGNRKNVFSILFIIFTLFFYLASGLLAKYYDASNVWMFKLDELITGRIKWLHEYYLMYGFTFFPKEIYREINSMGIGTSYVWLDSGYGSLLIEKGFLFSLIVFILFIFLLYLLGKIKDKATMNFIIIFSFIISIHLVSERFFLIYPTPNMLPIVLLVPIYKQIKNYKRDGN